MKVIFLRLQRKRFTATMVFALSAIAYPVSADSLQCRTLISTVPPCFTLPFTTSETGVYNNGCHRASTHATDGSSTGYPLLTSGPVNNVIAHGYWNKPDPSLRVFGKPTVYFHFDLFELQGFVFSPSVLPGSTEVSVRIVHVDLYQSIKRDTVIKPGFISHEQRFSFKDVRDGFGTNIENTVTVQTNTSRKWVVVIGQHGSDPNNGAIWNKNTTVCQMPIVDAN